MFPANENTPSSSTVRYLSGATKEEEEENNDVVARDLTRERDCVYGYRSLNRSPELNVQRCFTRKSVFKGEDVILPCSSENGKSLANSVVHWKNKENKYAFIYELGLHDSSWQDPQYRGRASLFYDELKNGNASMKLKDARVEDTGNYTCNLSNSVSERTFVTELFVCNSLCKKALTRKYVTEGEDVILPCFSHYDETLEKTGVHWKKASTDVFFCKPRCQTKDRWYCQDKQYRGRVSFFDTEPNNGSASMILRDTKMEDAGNYTCFLSHVCPESSTTELFVKKKCSPETNVFAAAWLPFFVIGGLLLVVALIKKYLFQSHWRQGKTNTIWYDLEKGEEEFSSDDTSGETVASEIRFN